MPWLAVTAALTVCSHVLCNPLIFPHFTSVTSCHLDLKE